MEKGREKEKKKARSEQKTLLYPGRRPASEDRPGQMRVMKPSASSCPKAKTLVRDDRQGRARAQDRQRTRRLLPPSIFGRAVTGKRQNLVMHRLSALERKALEREEGVLAGGVHGCPGRKGARASGLDAFETPTAAAEPDGPHQTLLLTVQRLQTRFDPEVRRGLLHSRIAR